MKLVRYLLGVLFPPAGIFLTYGFSSTLVISILLTVLGYIPGIIHAVWAISKSYENAGQGV
jgi:uncharacterized membrane protein YqaE (UPF0057 family)